MGGTSFDTSLIHDNEIRMRTRARIGEFDTCLNLVDVKAIGSGGGSIAWIDERGQPSVGPRSAGADPGPVCYGQGGREPTVTDAALVLGYLDPDYFLNGRDSLDRSAARRAIRDKLADPLDSSVEESAAGVLILTVAKMSNAARSVSMEKGYDPREFTMMAFGGTSPLFATWICDELGIDTVVVPQDGATFSARGLLDAEHKRSYVRSHHTTIDHKSIRKLADLFDSMESTAYQDFAAADHDPDSVSFSRQLDLRFEGQASELTVDLGGKSPEGIDPEWIKKQFLTEYETLYGEGTAWEGSGVEVQNVRLDATIPVETPDLSTATVSSEHDTNHQPVETREIYLPAENEYIDVDVFYGEQLSPGFKRDSPTIIQKAYTTVFLPPEASLRIDDQENIIINRR